MADVKRTGLRHALIVAIGVAMFVAAIGGVAVVGGRQARLKTEDLLAYSCSDLSDTYRGNIFSYLLMESKVVAGKVSAAKPPSPAEVRDLISYMAIDELYLVDQYGKVLAAADPAIVGRDLSNVPSMIEFLSLVETPDHLVEQPIRLSLADSSTEVFYGGFPQADGSLVICGYTVDHLRENFIESGEDLMSTWAIGDSGAYAVVDDRTGKLVFDIEGKVEAGSEFASFGDPNALKVDFDVDTTHTGMIGGKLCHYRVFDFYGLRLVAYMSHDEFFGSVKAMTIMVAIMLLLMYVVFGAVFHRVTVANQAVARMREAEDKQRIKDMVMATSIQKHSLPTVFPPYPKYADNFDIYAFMQTAKEVGGDFYDFYFVASGKIAMIAADVSGKGVPAAMFMMRAKTTLQALLKSGKPLAEAVAKANKRLCEGNLEDMFVTAWVGICDLHTGEIEYVNAGHNPPLIRRADGSVEWIRQRSGLALAAMEGMTYRSHKLTLALGDGLVLYTDGVTEAQYEDGELYGEKRLESATYAVEMAKDARRYCDDVMASLSKFVGNAEQADDITMLAFRMKRLVDDASHTAENA